MKTAINGIIKITPLLFTMAIFSTTMIDTTVPQIALAQLVTNETNSTSEAPIPKILLPPSLGGSIVFDPSGDDTFEANCYYGGVVYSPGSVVNMPGGPKTCHESGVWLK
jgi:hypothetical protein